MVQCKKCSKFISVTKEEIIKCKGPCEAVFHKRCVTKKSLKNGKCDGCMSPTGSPVIEEPNTAVTMADTNKKMDVIDMEKKLAELAELVDFVSGKYDKMCEFQIMAEKKIKALENKNAYLEKCNKSLEERVNELEEREKGKKVELAGLERKENEDITTVVTQVAHKLELDPSQIERAERVGREKPDSEKPLPVVITLKTREARDNWIKNRKYRLTNGQIYDTKNDSRIYVNENLTRYKRNLLWLTKTQLKKTYKYIWVQDGKILIRKSDELKKIFSIRDERDIERFIEKD